MLFEYTTESGTTTWLASDAVLRVESMGSLGCNIWTRDGIRYRSKDLAKDVVREVNTALRLSKERCNDK